jgi:hypothetical protein
MKANLGQTRVTRLALSFVSTLRLQQRVAGAVEAAGEEPE